MLTMLESLNYIFRNPKNHNLSNLPHHAVEKLQKKTMVSSEKPQLGKQRWRARLGILRVKFLFIYIYIYIYSLNWLYLWFFQLCSACYNNRLSWLNYTHRLLVEGPMKLVWFYVGAEDFSVLRCVQMYPVA